MYSKEEAARLRQQFWISFGQYMKPVPSASGSTVHWVNYKTGVKNIFFKMDVTNKQAIIAIQLTHSDPDIRHLIFEQFEEFKLMFTNAMSEEWDWAKDFTDDYGKTVSQIYTSLTAVSVFNQQHWPDLISFFKPRIIALDEFWDHVKPVFEDLI
ncbi:hypothetical protein ASE92_18525 [Pedobacter sp. Leaf41]|jgi:hypothetical protein|uniref:DUF4268 domain-containing protein n=1 Tax=Pedobacter sp. Leaf41 TaxID=1736218 RepID=UPI00070368E3|nr:DUF4268 domain-containing protein [Pedobacter sp. Leaf41]KQN32590.1 hypothetical protein ASE92_18525 [Pedobacter sp. Leaf41]RZL38656.1 MAG: DUF4268 domain-containing protein [Pedobacter sp.]